MSVVEPVIPDDTTPQDAMSLRTPSVSSAVRGRSAPHPLARPFSPQRLIPATGAALAASLAGVLAIRAAAVSATGDTSRFTPLRPGSVVSLTVIGVLLATATCLWLNRASDRPVAAFRKVALAATLLSFTPDAAIWLTAHYPETRAATVLPLMAMHVLVASVCVVLLPSLGRTPR